MGNEGGELAPDNGKNLGTIFNNDVNNILCHLDGTQSGEEIAAQYRAVLGNLLAAKPRILAQNVGLPDPVIYRSSAATTLDKHIVEATMKNWKAIFSKRDRASKEGLRKSAADQAACMNRLLDAGTDPLAVTIEECRKHNVLILASYRMNAEDWYDQTQLLSDFGRAHPEWRIPMPEEELRFHREAGRRASPDLVMYPEGFTGALDYAIPQVYDHMRAIFSEVAESYDIDGIEFDWRRWGHMISDPLKNHPVLTRMVRETRGMLDEVAKKKGRNHLLLGVRVGPMLAGPFRPEDFPGTTFSYSNASCRDLGLDVRTWISEGLVDYVCPTLFWPRWPGLPRIREFVELACGTQVGIYPTLFPLPDWLEERAAEMAEMIAPEDAAGLRRYKEGFCELAQRIYEEGADGISAYNWFFHHRPQGGNAIQAEMLSVMGDRKALSSYCGQSGRSSE